MMQQHMAANAWDTSLCFAIIVFAAIANIIFLTSYVDHLWVFLVVCINLVIIVLSVFGFMTVIEIHEYLVDDFD